MASDTDRPGQYPTLKLIIGLVITTGLVVSGVWAFFFDRTMELKDENMELLKKQNAQLREVGGVPEAVKKLEQRLIPLTLAFALDPFDGKAKVGAGQKNPTDLTMLIIKAEEFRKDRKFDLASSKLDEIDSLHPGFHGTPYFRFLIERDKGNSQEALALAEQAINSLHDDKRILPAYKFVVETNVQMGEKKKAEDFCLAAIRLDPKKETWRKFFLENFGYEPSIPNE